MPDFAIVSAAANTGIGTQDFTSSGFGTPKGALFFLSYGLTDGTVVDHAMIAVGATDGTNSGSFASRSEDNVVSDGDRKVSSTDCITTILETTGVVSGSAAFSAWITDGVRINWTDAPPAGFIVKCVLFGGTGVSNCTQGVASTPGIVGNATDVTTVGFQPDVVITYGSEISHFTPTLGFVVNDGSNTQRSMSCGHISTSNPTNVLGGVDETSVARAALEGVGGSEAQIQDFDASGFSLYQRVAATVLTVRYLALKLNGLSAKVLTSTSPTANGDHTITGAGFTPQFGLMLHSSVQTVDSKNDEQAEVIGYSAFTATTAACIATHTDDAVATANTESITNNIPVSLRKNAAAYMTATFSAFTSDGVTFNYTVAPGAATLRPVLFIQAGRTTPMFRGS